MNKKIILLTLITLLISDLIFAQDWADEPEKEPISFFAGLNLGTFLANKNTAIAYTGTDAITPYGINYILTLPSFKPTFDEYFEHPYNIEEFPQNPSYKTVVDIGIHAGINLGNGNSIYIDINTSNLKYEQFFTIAVDNPYNGTPQPTFEKIPLIGKEKRINVNLGAQISVYHKDRATIYLPVFGNFNSAKVLRNYFVINNREYEIHHQNPFDPTAQTGGFGYGAGSGLGFKYKLNENISADLNYSLYYTKTKINESINGFGVSNGFLIRLIWTQN